jgi:hypothetical protein
MLLIELRELREIEHVFSLSSHPRRIRRIIVVAFISNKAFAEVQRVAMIVLSKCSATRRPHVLVLQFVEIFAPVLARSQS